MAYILVVNPAILGNAVPEDGSITTQGIAAGTALVAGIMTILMGVVANYPLALAAGSASMRLSPSPWSSVPA